MPRDINGTYTLPAGNPVISGTIIESVWCNTTMEDIAYALTYSLSRTGDGGMLAPFLFADGTEGNPGISWVNEPTSGLWRDALNSFWYSVGGENVFHITKDGIELAPGKTFGGLTGLGGVVIQDADPAPVDKGVQWFESDTGAMYLRYQNPDLTYAYIRTNGAGLLIPPAAPRVTEIVTSNAPTPNVDTTDMFIITALAANATFAAPLGAPAQGQGLLIRVKDDGTPRTLTWNSAYVQAGDNLPATTTANKVIYVALFYNSNRGKYECVRVAEEA